VLGRHQYLVLADGRFGPETSKTANSAIRYLPERVRGVIEPRSSGRTVQEILGFGGNIPIVSTVADGLALNPTALLIGIAPTGGQLPESWRPALKTAIHAGLDIVSGLHFHLADDTEISMLARAHGVQLLDLRHPPGNLPIGTGKARLVEPTVVLTVGTDCNIGKMTAALQLRSALVARGRRVGFAATGQTGILIEGWGIAVDAVVADFVAGAAERLVLQAAEGNEIVLVEGQGSLIHPGYSGVTLGLLHGAMPSAMILCHQPTRTTVSGGGGAYEWVRLPALGEAIRRYEDAMAHFRESRVVGVALNTYDLGEDQAREAVARAAEETGLPAADPVRHDPAPLVDAILRQARSDERKAV
jgi:uncharacterized NAD-dependent epimerase/dehydratase family protein